MASSDNVLRGGLTPKHVDLDELLKILEFVDGPIETIRPRLVDSSEEAWDTPAPEFQLSRLTVNRAPIVRRPSGPEILLCVEGDLEIDDDGGAAQVALTSGAAAFIPGRTQRYELSGNGVAFRATVGLLAQSV